MKCFLRFKTAPATSGLMRRLAPWLVVKQSHTKTHGGDGWPPTWMELQARGIRVGKEQVQKLVKSYGIRAKGKRRLKGTTDSSHDLAAAPNLLERQFRVAEPDRVWAGDITYIATDEGWLFLAVVTDLFSRKVVGWSLREDMTSDIVIAALRMAWLRRRPGEQDGLIFHSDRGSQYASHHFRDVLTEYGIAASMSRRGNCWDNACSETLFGSLKVERLKGKRFATKRQAKEETIAWLVWYNKTRLDLTLDYVSPVWFKQDWFAAPATSEPIRELALGARIPGGRSDCQPILTLNFPKTSRHATNCHYT